IIGERQDKLQVFSAAHVTGSENEIADFMNRPEFRGDVLFLSAPPPLYHRVDASFLSKNERLAAVPKVLEFGANRLRVEVDVPADAWLAYSDAWDPNWRATVDGTPTPVERANLAYKAVRLHAGRNLVEFRFVAPLRAACTLGVAVVSVLWCGVLAVWT